MLQSIQFLRGFAVLAVILSHSISRTFREGGHVPGFLVEKPELVIVGHFGVDLFFVISGFLMFYLNHNKFGRLSSIKYFLISRAIRIVPLYWLLSLLALFVLILWPNLFSYREGVELAWVLGSFLFFPVTTSYGLSSPLLGVGWTLNYEVFFYLFFAFFMLFSLRWLFFGVLIYSLAIFFLGDQQLRSTGGYWDLVLSFMVIEFFLGVLAGYLFVNFFDMLESFRAFLLVASLALFLYSILDVPHTYHDRLFVWGGFSFFLLLYFLVLEHRGQFKYSVVFCSLGDWSYSAYLVQVFTIPFFVKLSILVAPDFRLSHYAIYILPLLVTAFTLVCACILYHGFERPAGKYLSMLFK